MENQKAIPASNPKDWFDQNNEPKSDNYQALGDKYRVLNDDTKAQLTANVIHLISTINGPDKEMSVNLQLCHWFRMDMGLGMAIANGLNINLQDLMQNMQRA